MSPEPIATPGRIAVVGAGAVGAYYGARLAHAGEDVTLLLRSDAAAVREHGLTVRVLAEPRETFRVQPRVAVTPAEIGPVDLVLVGLKATANDALPDLLPPLLHETTALLTLQNGLGSDEQLARLFGAGRVLGALCFICLNRVAPGAIECYLHGSISLGEFGRPAGARARGIAEAFRRAGVKCLVADNLAEIRWRKLVWNVPFNGLSIAAGGVATDRILSDPALLAETRALMKEIQAAAAALGFAISDDFLEKQVTATRAMGAYKPSSLVDYLGGRAVEVEAIWGEPLRRAQAARVATPALVRLYERLRGMCRAR